MRGIGRRGAVRLGVGAIVLSIVAVGGWKLMKPAETEHGPIVVGTTERVSSLDPAGTYEAGSWKLFSNLFQSLMTIAPGSVDPVPDAAEECRFTDSALRHYRCTLREGLTFSSGRPMTADDVVHSFDRVLSIADEQGPGSLFESLQEVRSRGRVVEFRLKSADATFPFKVASGAGSIVDRESYPGGSLRTDTQISGSGPYLLEEYESGSLARLVPNPDYLGAQDMPLHPIDVRYFEEPEELAAAWKKEEIDVNDGQMPPADIADTSPSDEGVVISEQSGLDIRSLVFNHRESSTMAQRPVRQAVASLVDRAALARQVHKRTVEPLYSLIPQGVAGHGTPFFDRYPERDVGAAEKLLQGAGVETPVRFELAYSRGVAAEKEAEELGAQLETSGLFEVTLRYYEWEDFLEGFAEGEFDAFVIGWFPDYPDPDTFTGSLVGTENAYHTGYSDRTIDELIRTTRRSYDRSRVIPEFKEIHRRVAEDVPLLPLWQQKDYVITTDDVAGAQYLTDSSGIWRLWELDLI